MLKFSRFTAAAALGAVLLATGARANPTDFAVAISFDNVAAFNSSGGNAAANLASAARFSFTPPVSGGPNGNTTGNPVTADAVLAAELAYPSFLSSTNLGLSGTGGTTALGGTNSFYFFNFTDVNSSGVATGDIVGSFETATGSVVVTTDTAHFVDVSLTGIFVPSTANASSGYVDTPAILNVGFTSNCVLSFCSVSASGTLVAGPIASAVPEPANWALMIGGIGLLGAVAKRRRSAIIAV